MKFSRTVGKGGITTQPAATGDWPKGLRKGETRVRFLAEIEGWQEYWEHFDETAKFFPCTGDKRTCPGCTSSSERTARASKRYLAPALDPKTGKVFGLKLGIDLANRLSLRNDRNGGTITNRDYTLIRTGDGLETEYDVEQEEKVPIDLSVYEGALDLEEMLSSQFAAAWPDFSPDGSRSEPREEQPQAAKAPAAKAVRGRVGTRKPGSAPDTAAQADPEPEEPNVLVEDDPPPFSEAPASAGTGPATEEPDDDDEPDSAEDAGVPGDSDDESVEMTEEDLRAMSRPDLIKLARQAELPITLTMSREQIVDLFLEQFTV